MPDSNQHPSRREFNKLTLAAFGGLLAGVAPGCNQKNKNEPPVAGSGTQSGDPAQAARPDENLLLDEPHVCRGLNACKNLGKTGANDCAGQGVCATANTHTCHAENECKGQGGCGSTFGQNQCKGLGECGVPLRRGTWDKARQKFEEVMAREGKPVGPPPAA